ncbi:hypothetical protein RVS70_05080 [Virgibacillus sp. M23]|uniref:hypothetical protein n=1 Tax=Virgibacillus sp. M23 TaxID=3079030 RepID=UPI002A90C61B|nr:hypothetical protein [Virgibacillus sp. M23]MDY7043573.1 hypothetical protein [Virgibacillus sp. M23]
MNKQSKRHHKIVFNKASTTDAFILEQQQRMQKVQVITKKAEHKPSVLVIGVSKGTYFYYAPKWAIIDE